MWATLKGFADVVETLLSNGAEVNAKTTEGLTAQRTSQRIIADLKRSLGEAENRTTMKKKVSPGIAWPGTNGFFEYWKGPAANNPMNP